MAVSDRTDNPPAPIPRPPTLRFSFCPTFSRKTQYLHADRWSISRSSIRESISPTPTHAPPICETTSVLTPSQTAVMIRSFSSPQRPSLSYVSILHNQTKVANRSTDYHSRRVEVLIMIEWHFCPSRNIGSDLWVFSAFCSPLKCSTVISRQVEDNRGRSLTVR